MGISPFLTSVRGTNRPRTSSHQLAYILPRPFVRVVLLVVVVLSLAASVSGCSDILLGSVITRTLQPGADKETREGIHCRV